jgi:diaminohydroxyphosphoribosylaminopyrimidine deaminase/5-amino-6-(5-phosphoribosylamino)uracil reductase
VSEKQEFNPVDIEYMRLCLELAEEGATRVSPNPMVGAVVLDKDGNIAGQGYHKEYGGPHGEIFALKEAGNRASGGTLYINLEPCCHHGKTPPCVNKVIESGISRIVIAMTDPNPRVAGRSIELMKAAGINVTVGVLEKEARELNKAFYKFMTTGFPLVISKIAMTLDGKIATRTQSSKWINSEDSRLLAHHWRNRFDAILTGSATVQSDNPSLNCRIPGGKDPVRVVIDSQIVTDPAANVYTIKSASHAILVTSHNHTKEQLKKYGKNSNISIYKSPITEEGKIDLVNLMKYLATEHRIHSIMLEAGPVLNGAMLKMGLIDKFYIFIAPKIIGDDKAYSPIKGIETLDINSSILLHEVKTRQIGNDVLIKAWIKDDFRLLD